MLTTHHHYLLYLAKSSPLPQLCLLCVDRNERPISDLDKTTREPPSYTTARGAGEVYFSAVYSKGCFMSLTLASKWGARLFSRVRTSIKQKEGEFWGPVRFGQRSWEKQPVRHKHTGGLSVAAIEVDDGSGRGKNHVSSTPTGNKFRTHHQTNAPRGPRWRLLRMNVNASPALEHAATHLSVYRAQTNILTAYFRLYFRKRGRWFSQIAHPRIPRAEMSPVYAHAPHQEHESSPFSRKAPPISFSHGKKRFLSFLPIEWPL